MLKILNIQSDELMDLVRIYCPDLNPEQIYSSRPSFEVRRKLSDILIKSMLPEVPDVSIYRHESGRPYLGSHQVASLPCISISHSGSWIGLVLSDPAKYTTLDLEDMSLARSHDKIAQNFFTDQEQVFFKKRGLIGFYQVWTAKEAIAKNLDQTISSLLRVDIGQMLENSSLDVSFDIDFLGHKFTLTQQVFDKKESLMVTSCECIFA